MKLFRCQACGQVLYFENIRCERCGHALGYLPEEAALSALEPAGPGRWQALARPQGHVRRCANAMYDACNWLVAMDSPEAYCAACRHNRTIPELGAADNLEDWRRWQGALHRLVYTLQRLRLPLANRIDDPRHGLVFDVLADPVPGSGPKVLTGHDEGVVTLASSEADDAERERRRRAMGEPYRTLLGHLRHETGHHYWDLLVRNAGRLEECRAVFGDERQDYAASLQTHYAHGAPVDWRVAYISAYATSHPWEDFAETWAHYLHILDTLEMAAAFGLRIAAQVAGGPASIGRRPDEPALAADIDFDPYGGTSITDLVKAWLPLADAMNNFNRCMGTADPYPFVLPPPVVAKLRYIHHLVNGDLVP